MASVALNTDPLDTLGNGAQRREGRNVYPIPLTATGVVVDIRGGLATVRTERSFRNAEATAIEATLTFPVPGDAILTGVRATIDGRDLVAVAQPSKKARETYEDALDRGKAAVLHEEKIRGVHMLSLGNLAPGKEAKVTVTFVAPLSFAGPSPSLRVPFTVGDVYGRSPLLPSDALVTSHDVAFEADIAVTSDAGVPQVAGLGSASGKVPLDRAVEIVVPGWTASPLRGRSADGRAVSVTVEPLGSGELPLGLTVLFDRSGSTNEGIQGDAGRTVWMAMRDGVHAGIKASWRDGDDVSVTEFDDGYREIGRAGTLDGVLRLVAAIRPRGGGTEIGVPLIATASAHKGRDILLVTDGRSHALDVQAASRLGARVSVVLVGTGALDAAVGHVAALTGGQTFVAVGADVEGAVRAALASLRVASSPTEARDFEGGLPSEAAALRGGARVTMAWLADGSEEPADEVGRFAAGLLLPGLSEDKATEVAVAHGLCTHLTSLVVVDEAGESVEGIPATRKVPLQASAGGGLGLMSASSMAMSFASAGGMSKGLVRSSMRSLAPRAMLSASPERGGLDSFGGASWDSFMETSCEADDTADATGASWTSRPTTDARSLGIGGRKGEQRKRSGRTTAFPEGPDLGDIGGGLPADPIPAWPEVMPTLPPVPAPPAQIGQPALARIMDLRAAAARVDWADVAPRVASGGISAFASDVRLLLLQVAGLDPVRALAASLGATPEQVAVALLAHAAGEGNRPAGRVARQGLKGAAPDALKAALASVGL